MFNLDVEGKKKESAVIAREFRQMSLCSETMVVEKVRSGIEIGDAEFLMSLKGSVRFYGFPGACRRCNPVEGNKVI